MTAQLNIAPHATGAAESESRNELRPALLSPTTAEESGQVRSRPMLLLERTMYRDGFAPFTSLFTVSLRGDINEPRLHQALAHMQAKHPLLNCVVEETDGRTRFVMRDQPLPVPLRIVDRKTGCDWESEARREWATPFGSTQGPLVRMVWLRGEGVHELMLVAHHCICDGPSGMTLLRDCFAAYDDPRGEIDVYDSLGAIEDLVPEELSRQRSFRRRVRHRSALLRLGLLAKARRRPGTSRTLGADRMYFHRWQLDATEAGMLIDRCREENVTVLSAASVAILQAFREVRGAGALKHAYTMVNARRFLPQLHREALFGLAPGVELRIQALLSPGATPGSAFWDKARATRDDLTRRIDRLRNQFYESLAALETLHDRYPRLIADTEAAPAVRHVTFSNLGRIDLPERYRSFRIERVYSPLVMVSPSPANTVVLSSFGGAMEFAIISDEAALPRSRASAIGARTMAILRSSAAIVVPNGSRADGKSHAPETVTT
jgi:hypothetical protein